MFERLHSTQTTLWAVHGATMSLRALEAFYGSLMIEQQRQFSGQTDTRATTAPLGDAPSSYDARHAIDRLDFAVDCLAAAIFAMSHLGMALGDFHNRLSKQQKAQFDSSIR